MCKSKYEINGDALSAHVNLDVACTIMHYATFKCNLRHGGRAC